MAHVRILVRHGGAWDEGRRKYEGGVLKGIVVPKEITHKDLQSELYDLAEVDPTKFDIKIRCIYEIKGEKEAPPFELSNDRDLKFYILSENPLEVPLYLSFEPTSNRSMKVLNKDYNSVSGSNQVQNLNPHPPIGMDTLDENEVDIGEVQGPGRIYKPRDIIEDMRQDYGINMIYEKAWRARENAYERVRGSPEESYNLLRRYGEALKFTNPGFLNCIRPVIVMDETFLKNKYRVVLRKLKGAIGEVPNLGFVTDQKTCFAKGISSVFPSAFHGLCVQHLSQNLHDKYKNDTVATLFYNASRTYRESTFVEAWRHLLAFPNGSGKYLNDVGIARWSRVHCPGRRYNMMTTNIAESMNSILKEPRDFPIASFLENVRALLQRWFWERREEGIKVTSTLTKWAELVIQKKQEGALTMKVNPINCYQFHVKDLDKEEVVNLRTKECTCKEFQAKQLPCSHAIAAARDRNINVYSLCANYYTNECLLAAYAEAVYPVGNQSDWKTSEDYVHMTVLPPKVVKRVDRPKKKRIPSVGEAPKLHKMAVPSDKYFPATVSCQVHKISNLIKDKLTKDQLQIYLKTVTQMESILGKNVHFTQKEFNIITGLWPTNNPLEKDCDSKRLQNLLIGSENKKLITCLEIEEIFKNFEFTNDDDAVKVALAVFIETVMVRKDKKTQFDMDILGRVDDEEAFKRFDWSTFFYTRLLNSLKTSLQGKKEAYELKKTRSSKAVSYYNIKGYVLAFQVWSYEVLSTANEHLATRNSKGLIPRILRWNCTQAPSYKMLQKNIFDNKNTVVQPKLKMSTQEKAFMESRIRGDDNMQMEDDESIGAMNNKSLKQSDSSPHREQLTPQREQSQTVADESEMHPITKKKHFRSKKSNDKEEQSHSKSYKKLKKEINEVRKDLSTLISIVCRMDDTTTKQSLELYEMKQILERLVQECGSDISIDGRDTDLLMTIRDISDSISHQIQKETDLPQMITTLSLVSQPLAICELAPLDQTVHEESQLLGINKPDCIVWNHIFDTHLVTPDNKKAEWTDPTTHLTIWTEKDVEYYFNPAVCDYDQIPKWGDVNYVISCINIKEHWLAIATDMRKCKIYVFDSMPNYVEQKLVDEAFQMSARCIPSLAIAIGVNLHSDHFTYGPWPICRSKATLQKGHSLDCGIFCSKFVECLVTGSDLGCLTVPNMKLFRQQYVLELWANKYFC
ncbi:MuDRA-like transposase [Cucumis melo var. makuwa]|uniref:MuDRA-like transposase n=1 Tax=Cucumis melo var. makuwa TaxID=1194695 RepID=A0A5A7VF66_CUCMM|nr:MuDRA-like transposase [Cucumis melo var. makuwa]